MGTLLNRRRYMGGGSSLPYDAKIEYLQSTGTAYIDTGIIPTLSYSVEMEFKWVSPFSSADASANLFGCINGWGENGFAIVYTHQSNRKAFYNCWGNDFRENNNTDLSYLLDTWHTLSFTNKKTLVDGTQIGQTSTGTGNPIGSVYLFCAKNWASGTFYGVGTTKQISSFKMYDASSELVMDLIPVRKGTTGYMYDKISKQLFGNAGTDAFVLGPDISTLPYDERVEYLQSSGTQYIDTGIVPTANTNILIEFETTYLSGSSAYAVFGCRVSAGSKSFQMIQYQTDSSQKWRWDYGTSINNCSSVQSGMTTAVSNGDALTIYGSTARGGTFQTTTLNMYLFASNQNGSLWGLHPYLKIKSFRVYEDNTPIMDLIPVRVSQTGYMYDRVSGELFGNSGTGSFTLGPDKT